MEKNTSLTLDNYENLLNKIQNCPEKEQVELVEELLKNGLDVNLLNYIYSVDKNGCFSLNGEIQSLYDIMNIEMFPILKKSGCKINDAYFILKFLTNITNITKNPIFNEKIASLSLQTRFEKLKENLHVFGLDNFNQLIDKLNISNEELTAIYQGKESYCDLFDNTGKYYTYSRCSFYDLWINNTIINLQYNYKNQSKSKIQKQLKQDIDYLESIGLNIKNRDLNINYIYLNIKNMTQYLNIIGMLLKNEIKLDLNQIIKIIYKQQKEYKLLDNISGSKIGIFDFLRKNNKKLSDYIEITYFMNEKTINKYINTLYDEGYQFDDYLPFLMNNIQSTKLIDFLIAFYKDDFYNEVVGRESKFIKDDNLSKLCVSLKKYLYLKIDFKNQEDFNNAFYINGCSFLKKIFHQKKYSVNFIKELLKNNKTKDFLVNYINNNTNNFFGETILDEPDLFYKLLLENNIAFTLTEDKYLIKTTDYNLCDLKDLNKLSILYNNISKYYKLVYPIPTGKYYYTYRTTQETIAKNIITRFNYAVKAKNNEFDLDNIFDLDLNNIFDIYTETIEIKIKMKIPKKLLNNSEEMNKNDKLGYNIYDYYFSILALLIYIKNYMKYLDDYDYYKTRHCYQTVKSYDLLDKKFHSLIKELDATLFKNGFKLNKRQIDFLEDICEVQPFDGEDTGLLTHIKNDFEKDCISEELGLNKDNKNKKPQICSTINNKFI